MRRIKFLSVFVLLALAELRRQIMRKHIIIPAVIVGILVIGGAFSLVSASSLEQGQLIFSVPVGSGPGEIGYETGPEIRP